jgi:CelD/BcsL family acetyltransferase involved in cellulose biosynthesis
MARVELIEADDGISPSLGAAWQELARRRAAAPFLEPGWFAAWRRSFGRGSLAILALRRDGELAGVLPMERRRWGLASPTNPQTPLFGPLAERPEDAVSLAFAALEQSPATVAMDYLDEGVDGLAALDAAAREARVRVSASLLARSPYIDTRGDLSAYEATLDAKVLREIRRRRRRLETEGPVELQVADGSARLEELLDEGVRLEGAAWKASSGTAIGSDDATLSFYRSVARWAAEAGMLRLAFLRVAGRPVAFDFCLERDGSHYLLKTGFDPAARRLGPGAMIRREMIARAFNEALSSYEFLGKDEPWKLRWAAAARVRMSARAFAPSVAGSLSRLWWTGLRPLAKRALRRS